MTLDVRFPGHPLPTVKAPVFEVVVHGVPRPQGSKKAIRHKHTGKPITIESSGENLADWRGDVLRAAADVRRGIKIPTIVGPVATDIEFRFPRPKSHYGTGRNALVLKPTAPRYPISRGRHGDKEKLERAVNDALTYAGVWEDDILVVDSHTTRVWATEVHGDHGPGATIRVWPLKSTITETDPWPDDPEGR